MDRIPVYFVPGLAASSQIFEKIKLPSDVFEVVFLEWFLPLEKESLNAYAKRMAANVHHRNPVLIGVSFGGVLVQEMAQFVNPRKVIIISSAKCNSEFPRRMKVAKSTKLYKILPLSWFENLGSMQSWPLGTTIHERLKLYEKFFAMRDRRYLNWAVEQIILWDRAVPDKNVIHIHGDADAIFPPQYIRNFIPVKGGTHIMILNRYKWFNENLPKIILNEQ